LRSIRDRGAIGLYLKGYHYSVNLHTMIFLEILQAKAVFMLLLLLTVVLPAWAVITYYRRKEKDNPSDKEEEQ